MTEIRTEAEFGKAVTCSELSGELMQMVAKCKVSIVKREGGEWLKRQK
jgi:hypothetical protein